jgi:diaminopimelate epimerase
VNFAALQSDGLLRVRTFERGVEAETLSCGTGAVAVAKVASHLYGLKMPLVLHFPGGDLKVWEKESRMHLAGDAQKVFTGSFSLLSN